MKLYDVEQIRSDANQSVLKGPVTNDYPLDLKQVYQFMNEALASEILCVLRYQHHAIVAKGIDFPQVASEFEEHAADEQKHVEMIAERIDQLGGDPDLNPKTVTDRAATEYGRAETLSDMIKDPTSRRMFEKILQDEEDHATDLSDLLASVDPRSKPAQVA
jgi:bacterioferritin